MMDRDRPAAKMRGWRKKLGLNQKQAAEAARISQGTWSFIERGEREPTLEQAFRLEKLTGVRAVEWLSSEQLKVGRIAA